MSTHLSLVPENEPATAVHRIPLMRLCAGEPLVLTDDELDLVALVNVAGDLEAPMLDPGVDPDDYRLAEVLVEYLCQHFGIARHGKGDRLQDVQSAYRRHLIPFLLELDATRPAGRRGVAHLRITHLEKLPRVLAGDLPLPAATVAGDLLGRRGVACSFLTLNDAALVTLGGADELENAIATGQVPPLTDARTGEDIVRAADLREAGLLDERQRPHGLAKSTAKNLLRSLGLAIDRARDHGAGIRGTFKLEAIEPLPPQRLREPKPDTPYVPIHAVKDAAAHLPVIMQVVLWLCRLLGMRISEVFGLQVSDYVRDDNRQGWLAITKQGGVSSLGREPETGRFQRQDSKGHTKSAAGKRFIPIPHQLADLIEHLIAVFHIDQHTGVTCWNNRLIPGIEKDDAAGQSTFRRWLKAAQEVTGFFFDPHSGRAALITDLRNAGFSERLTHDYAGHELDDPTVQDQSYDLGPFPQMLVPIAEHLGHQIESDLGVQDLRVPTAARETWGTGTRWYARRHDIEARLVEQGWRIRGEFEPGLGHLLTVAQVAATIDKSEPYTRRLMSAGEIPACQRSWKRREVWMAWEVDVRRYQAEAEGPTLSDLATELGLVYAQVWHIARKLELIPDGRAAGTAIRLNADRAVRLRMEIRGQQAAGEKAITVRAAADRLDLDHNAVATLLRQGHLEQVPNPSGGRDRYLSVASVEAYAHSYPIDGASSDSGHAVTGGEMRKALRVTRPQLTTLVTTRQIATCSKPGSRHTYYSVESAIQWAQRSGSPGAVVRLRELLGPEWAQSVDPAGDHADNEVGSEVRLDERAHDDPGSTT